MWRVLNVPGVLRVVSRKNVCVLRVDVPACDKLLRVSGCPYPARPHPALGTSAVTVGLHG